MATFSPQFAFLSITYSTNTERLVYTSCTWVQGDRYLHSYKSSDTHSVRGKEQRLHKGFILVFWKFWLFRLDWGESCLRDQISLQVTPDGWNVWHLAGGQGRGCSGKRPGTIVGIGSSRKLLALRWRKVIAGYVCGEKSLMTMQEWLRGKNRGCEVNIKRRVGFGSLFWGRVCRTRDWQHVGAGREGKDFKETLRFLAGSTTQVMLPSVDVARREPDPMRKEYSERD